MYRIRVILWIHDYRHHLVKAETKTTYARDGAGKTQERGRTVHVLMKFHYITLRLF